MSEQTCHIPIILQDNHRTLRQTCDKVRITYLQKVISPPLPIHVLKQRASLSSTAVSVLYSLVAVLELWAAVAAIAAATAGSSFSVVGVWSSSRHFARLSLRPWLG